MPVDIRVPALGESVIEATVGRWNKKEGDPVRKDEVVVELETDKITVEVTAPAGGRLIKIKKQEGDKVRLNELLAEMVQMDITNPASQSPLNMLTFDPVEYEIRGRPRSAEWVTYRAKIAGGWLVGDPGSHRYCFVYDPYHEWDGGSPT
jgi:pyruvate/2-oxoglutarate dehydrogenase complex dihydrolipoamide acyltransferase (E2) component